MFAPWNPTLQGLGWSQVMNKKKYFEAVTKKLATLEKLQKKHLKSSWLVVSTHLKNISQNGNLPQIGMKIKNI